MIVAFGGGEIVLRGILPVVDGVAVGANECDVTSPKEVRTTMARYDPDVIVFTAGVSYPAPVASSTLGAWRAELEVNLWGGYVVAAEATRRTPVPVMIFLASLAGLYGKPNHSGYSASKAGLISLVQSLAMEGHDAYAISPGRVDTAMRERDYPGEDPRTRLQPGEIGAVVKDILAGRYQPGDNLVIRMRGHEVLPVEVHRGDGWRERLHVGEPVTC